MGGGGRGMPGVSKKGSKGSRERRKMGRKVGKGGYKGERGGGRGGTVGMSSVKRKFVLQPSWKGWEPFSQWGVKLSSYEKKNPTKDAPRALKSGDEKTVAYNNLVHVGKSECNKRHKISAHHASIQTK